MLVPQTSLTCNATCWPFNFIFQIPGSIPKHSIIFNLHIFLVSYGLSQFCTLPLFVPPFIMQVCCVMSLHWDLFGVFVKMRLGPWAVGRKTTEVRCHFHRTLSQAHAYRKHSSLPFMLHLIIWLKEILSNFSDFPSSMLYSLEGRRCA